jgi:hypothetical protein
MKKKECPFKIKGLTTQSIDNFETLKLGYQPHYIDNAPYDACDIRNLNKCVGESKCPIMKRN